MKKVALLFTAISFSLLAQGIPNAGFETWTNGNPDGWITSNIAAIPPVFPGVFPITQSTDKSSGSSSAKLELVDFDGDPYPAVIYSYFPATEKYGSLTGFYKFVPQSNGDILTINVWLFKGTTGFGTVGFGELETNSAVSSFTQFTVPIDFNNLSTEAPDSAWIWISVDDTSENPSIGAYALIDDLSWGGVVGVKELNSNIPTKFEMQHNYPNPFNPSTRIEYSIPVASLVQLKVYDIIGNEVADLVNEYQPAGRYRAEFDAANLSSGIYIAKLSAGSFAKTMKMTLLK